MRKEQQKFTQKPERYAGKIRKKDFYKAILELIEKKKVKQVLELGCASGDFLSFLPEDIRGVGIDASEELIAVALKTRKKENIDFFCCDVFDYEPQIKPDLVIMTGFLCTFLEYDKILEKALALTSKYIYINDFLNKYGIDCKYSFREKGESDFQTVYNIWSRENIENFFKEKNVKFEIEPYIVHENLGKSANPLYNFHANLDGNKILTNNGGVFLEGVSIYIEKKS
jgi:SAM-dependent methyltransferase